MKIEQEGKTGDADLYVFTGPDGKEHKFIISNVQKIVGGKSGEIEALGRAIVRIAMSAK